MGLLHICGKMNSPRVGDCTALSPLIICPPYQSLVIEFLCLNHL